MLTAGVRRVDKPWGHELIWAHTDGYVGKILHIRRGHRLSLQYHERKDETVFLYSGRMTLVLETAPGHIEELDVVPGQAYHIPVGRKHRMIAVEDCEVLEVSTPQLDDVVRIEDGYGRAGTSAP